MVGDVDSTEGQVTGMCVHRATAERNRPLQARQVGEVP